MHHSPHRCSRRNYIKVNDDHIDFIFAWRTDIAMKPSGILLLLTLSAIEKSE